MAHTGEELSDLQKSIFDKITTNDVVGLKSVVSDPKFNVDIYDENGMTPLQHAAFKGNKEIAQALLDRGADVNSGRHEHAYSALHFAALSGNLDLCLLLLNNGARSHALNSVNRTPAQMAAFVGNHDCVSAINNFVPKSEIEYFTVPKGLETKPKLEPFLASPLHKLIMQVNIHPIHILMSLQRTPLLLENNEQVRKILELMSEREMKRGVENNEVLSFKFHWLACIMAELEGYTSKEPTILDRSIKSLIRPSPQDDFARLCVRRFPHHESTIFRQLVSSITSSVKDAIPAGHVMLAINAAINGQRGFAADSQCGACGEEKAVRRCARCKQETYCGPECQKVHWSQHKKVCTPAPLEPSPAPSQMEPSAPEASLTPTAQQPDNQIPGSAQTLEVN